MNDRPGARPLDFERVTQNLYVGALRPIPGRVNLMKFGHSLPRAIYVYLLVLGGLLLASSPSQALTARHARHHDAAALPALRSGSVLVLDADTSSVLYSRHSDQPVPIASISKLLTAMVVLDARQPMEEQLEISPDDVAMGRGTASRLSVGTSLSRADLMHLALMSSENRAAHALGRNYPGGMSAFVQAMNDKAKALGMSSAHFVEPTGLSSHNVASPQDLSKLVIAASQDPTIRAFSTDPAYSVPVGRQMVEFHNTDRLVSNPGWEIIVQKTGYIAAGGKCLVMQAVIAGRSVVMVLLDSFGKYTRLADASRVKKWMESAQSALSSGRLSPVS